MSRFTSARMPLLVASTLFLLATALAPDRPAVQLGETRPLETALGDATLPTAADTWVDLLRGATSHAELEHFYLSRKPGEALDPVLDELGRAAARGVKVRLILDAGMHRTYPQPADSLATLANVSVRFIDYRKLAGGVQHAKFMLVDGTHAWLGSQNLDWRALSHIHELGARVTIPAVVTAFGDVFERDWAACDSTAVAPADHGTQRWPVAFRQDGEAGQLWASASPEKLNPRSLVWDRDVLLARVNASRKELVAQVLTYGTGGHGMTDSTLHRALLAAAGRGVKVKLLVSDWVLGGRGEADLRALAATPNIEVRISRVADWSKGYIPFARVEHCKYMVADGEWLWLGTSNWEPSYFYSSRNLAITVHHTPLAQRARRIFERGWTATSAIPLEAGKPIAPRVHGEQAPPGAVMYGE